MYFQMYVHISNESIERDTSFTSFYLARHNFWNFSGNIPQHNSKKIVLNKIKEIFDPKLATRIQNHNRVENIFKSPKRISQDLTII